MSASDYPEHLNPFSDEGVKKSGLHIGHSFKEFRKTLRQSFRIKKKSKEDVQLRRHHDSQYSRQALSQQEYKPPIILNYENVCTPALPRSRFRERLAMSYSPSTNGNTANPFDEASRLNDEVKVLAPRRKKRAPLPPKSSSSQSVNEDHSFGDKNDSKWSLTSLETDVSTENLSDLACSNDLDISSELQMFTKGMEKLKEDDNEVVGVDSSEETKGSNSRINIPDVVVSCVDDDAASCNGSTRIDDSNKTNDSIQEVYERQEKAGENTKTDSVTDDEIKDYSNGTEVNGEDTEVDEGKKESRDTSCSSNESLVIVDITQNLKNIEEVEELSVEDKSEDIDNEACTTFVEARATDTHDTTSSDDKSNGTQVEETAGEAEVSDGIQNEEFPISFNERKSIFITGSRDELNNKNSVYSEKISLYISGSQDNLDDDNNNKPIHEKNITSQSPKPTPKQRTTKLTKNDLLLGHNNNNNID